MTKRRRHAGGGRRPGGEFPGKSATFTTRIQPATRRALEEAAKARPDKSISAAAEYILKNVLQEPNGTSSRNNALAAAFILLAENIERRTKVSWREDPWTGFALANAAEHLVRHFAPAPASEGTPATPSAIEEMVAKMHQAHAELFRKPHFFGCMEADFLIREIEQATSSEPINEWTMPIFLSERRDKLGLIGSELKRTDNKKGKSK